MLWLRGRCAAARRKEIVLEMVTEGAGTTVIDLGNGTGLESDVSPPSSPKGPPRRIISRTTSGFGSGSTRSGGLPIVRYGSAVGASLALEDARRDLEIDMRRRSPNRRSEVICLTPEDIWHAYGRCPENTPGSHWLCYVTPVFPYAQDFGRISRFLRL